MTIFDTYQRPVIYSILDNGAHYLAEIVDEVSASCRYVYSQIPSQERVYQVAQSIFFSMIDRKTAVGSFVFQTIAAAGLGSIAFPVYIYYLIAINPAYIIKKHFLLLQILFSNYAGRGAQLGAQLAGLVFIIKTVQSAIPFILKLGFDASLEFAFKAFSACGLDRSDALFFAARAHVAFIEIDCNNDVGTVDLSRRMDPHDLSKHFEAVITALRESNSLSIVQAARLKAKEISIAAIKNSFELLYSLKFKGISKNALIFADAARAVCLADRAIAAYQANDSAANGLAASAKVAANEVDHFARIARIIYN
jgi:hypothetical protein